ncbi:class D sortase [Peribacillus tepidiphilus]|uniref:class D sortase n=1 Tax=Peribacillus tepidiphilus TaxID=2652445 RepID=UPI001290F7EA|nr:class D sortase [Peribacillus tepidiphilus]
MKRFKPNKKRVTYLIVGAFLLGFGLYFTSSNAFKLLLGYGMFQWNKAVKVEAVEETSKQEKNVPVKQNNTPLYPVKPEKGELIGELYIPKLDQTLPIYHGTDEDDLEKGVGHFAGSVLPGEKDNSVLSGHRDTVFRQLGKVGKGDLLVAKTSAGEFTYKVKKVRIVDKDDRTVIVPKPKATLTLTTCYPFDYIGSAPERYVLVAELASTKYAADKP